MSSAATRRARSVNVKLEQVTAVVLAGGFGTRVQHLLPGIPKPMAPVAGRPFLEWVVRYLAKQGIYQVVLSTGHLAEAIESHFQTHPIPGVTVQCFAESTPLGTAGGFLHAARQSRQAPAVWLVLNGDSLALTDLKLAVAPLAEAATMAVVVGRTVPDAARYGTLGIGASGELLRFEEKRAGSGVINSGIYLLKNSLLGEFSGARPLSFEQDVFPGLIARKLQPKVVVTTAPFLDIGTPESLPEGDAFIRGNPAHFLTDPE